MNAYLKKSISLILVLLILFCYLPINTVFAYGEWVEQATGYRVNAQHVVDQDMDRETGMYAIWDSVRSIMGCSEVFAAALLGNFEAECSWNWTRVETSWPDVLGSSSDSDDHYGFGMGQWTSPGRQQGILQTCVSLGVQWTDINAQITHAFNEIQTYDLWAQYKDCNDVSKLDEITTIIEEDYESPVPGSNQRRIDSAHEAYEKCTGRPVGSTSTTSTTTEGNQKGSLVSEWDLEGMPSKPSISETAVLIELPTGEDLSTGQKYTIGNIKTDIINREELNLIHTTRVLVAILGFLIVDYAFIFLCCWTFDRFNVFFDIKLLKIITFGRLEVMDDSIKNIGNNKGYVSLGRCLKIFTVTAIIGLLIVSGSMYVWIYHLFMNIRNYIINIF